MSHLSTQQLLGGIGAHGEIERRITGDLSLTKQKCNSLHCEELKKKEKWRIYNESGTTNMNEALFFLSFYFKCLILLKTAELWLSMNEPFTERLKQKLFSFFFLNFKIE